MYEQEMIEMLLETEFTDRYEKEPDRAVDVILPVLNTNPFFKKGLINYYKRIPINRLLIGDGGCEDNTIEIANQFPRVKVFDQKEFRSLGYRIRKLVEACESEFCVYLHADVFLPVNWFDAMYSHRREHNWYESDRKYFSLIVWEAQNMSQKRAYSGSQFGKTKELQEKLNVIEDDFLYRNEDIIISELMGKNDYLKYNDTFHYHQIQSKRGTKEPQIIITPKITRKKDVEWEKWVYEWQWKGIVKYCQPKPYLITAVRAAINVLVKNKAYNELEAKEWIESANPAWLPHIRRKWYQFWKI